MRKAELIKELEQRGVYIDPAWTVPELRATVLENRELVAKMAMGLSRFNLEELTKMCVDLKIALPTKRTKGELTKLLRTAYSGHANEEIDFGRHKGTLYKDVPMEYQKWAIKETEANEVAIAQPGEVHGVAKKNLEAKKVKALEVDIEEVAVIPVHDTKVDTKVMVDMKVTTKAANQDKHKKMATTTTTARKRETATDSDDSWMRMETQSDPEALEKIMQLETELALLRRAQHIDPRGTRSSGGSTGSGESA